MPPPSSVEAMAHIASIRDPRAEYRNFKLASGERMGAVVNTYRFGVYTRGIVTVDSSMCTCIIWSRAGR